ncbi:peptidoglycan editing factor PgeF [Aestuariibacter halophilus]|uniref:Purine nucleoside phosphorylase n=1 Tax=Fluctibacter halophilus TaxID=226011 RepID=A0ABS8G2E5_9ALTE|nr:peptidoglycan editing factor PgeF [Aestuariibacter halophilus]MCC2614752.1 peptidoglycan editing factor PgeF [Aestuariibacter halophilus]
MTSTPCKPLSLITPDWPDELGVRAYCTTRQGGLSTGAYTSLNLALHVGDDPDTVAANRSRLPGHDKIVWLEQVHSADCVSVDASSSGQPPIIADAAITDTTGLTVGVMTADCIPVLFCDIQGRQVAAAHAGWRGLLAGVLENTVHSFQAPAEQLLAWIGPCIRQAHFEVGADTVNAFADYPNHCVVVDNTWRIDLAGIAVERLNAAGVRAISDCGLCTYTDERRFYSHRRATHQGTAPTGRMFSAVMLSG